MPHLGHEVVWGGAGLPTLLASPVTAARFCCPWTTDPPGVQMNGGAATCGVGFLLFAISGAPHESGWKGGMPDQPYVVQARDLQVVANAPLVRPGIPKGRDPEAQVAAPYAIAGV